MSLAKILIAICAILMIFGALFAANESQLVPIKQIESEAGWNPPTKDMILSTQATDLTVDDSSIKKITITFKEEELLKTPVYSVNKDTLVLHEFTRTCFLRGVTAYSFNGAMFAYDVPCVAGGLDNGVKVYAGAVYVESYYDETGDGKFRTRYIGRKPLFIPRWLKLRNSK